MSHPQYEPSYGTPYDPSYGAPAPHGGPGGPPYGGYGPPPSNGLAVTALVLGIVSLLGGLVPLLGYVAIPFALAAIGFAFAGLSRSKAVGKGKGLAVGGLVTGVLSLVAITAWTAWFVVGTRDTVDLYTGDGIFSCAAVKDSLEDNVEEFRAAEGRQPESQDELVSEGYRTWSSSDFEIVMVDGQAEVVERDGGTC
ncbi:MAG TPA: DUF4190 domain-containing protein [Iamia sp.]|nr:DUF4190 domain-containing protein [Iamia sp.]